MSTTKLSTIYKMHGIKKKVVRMMKKAPHGRKKKIGIYFIDYNERKGNSKMQPLLTAYWTLLRILEVRFKQ